MTHRKSATMSALVKALLAGASILGLVAIPSGQAAPLVQITGPSPFAGCSIAGQPGINYPNAEVEPWVDANPLNSDNLIAGWQQDRWSDGGARGNVSAYSTDGGATWTSVVVPGLSLCSGGTFQRATDPWVSFAPNGIAYFNSLSFDNDLPNGSLGANAVLVNRSSDGGASWGPPKTLIFDNDGQAFNDKNSITADPTNSNYVYAVWDRLVDFTVPPVGSTAPATAGARKAGGGGDGVTKARQRLRQAMLLGPKPLNKAALWTGPTYFARTTNGGASWEPAKEIFATGNNDQTIGNLIEVLPNGDVIDFFTHLSTLGWGGVKLGLIKSTDKGANFGPVSYVSQMVITSTGTLTPDAKEPVRDANILFDTAVDRGTGNLRGNLYAVWQDGRSRNIDKVAFSMSTNGGASWSTPVIISKTPYSPNKLRNQAFLPSIVVGADHKVVVTYYDFRFDTNEDATEATDFWAISCDIDGGANCRTAAGWGGEIRLSPTSFDMLDAPVARGHFLGDYMGLVNAGGTVTSVFGKAVGPNLNDMFATTIP